MQKNNSRMDQAYLFRIVSMNLCFLHPAFIVLQGSSSPLLQNFWHIFFPLTVASDNYKHSIKPSTTQEFRNLFMLREQCGAGLPSNVNILYWGDQSGWLLPQQPVSNCWSGLLLTSSILPNRLMKIHLIVLETWRNRNVTPVAVVSSSLHLYLLFHNTEMPFYCHSLIDYEKRETEYCYGDFCFLFLRFFSSCDKTVLSSLKFCLGNQWS